MATLILSTVGNALGGPVGGAIGALIGQSLDQQILGGSKRGPRIGDFSIQSSSYGTAMPRIYGTMRVAGSVVWASDLVEGAATTGAKGQPDTVYSYSISIAVALSSRAIIDVRRIWADGKLIRDETGTFKINTIFRLHTGGEDQDVDPLIASAEGIDNTPAYRGLALAVFENMELVEFGNRIPFLTFEVVADGADPMVGDILEDASGGAVVCTAEQQMGGYAAAGSSMHAALQPLIDAFAIDLFDDGQLIRTAGEAAPVEAAEVLGCSASEASAVQIERQQEPASALPASLSLTFYDAARDYQTSDASAAAGEQSGETQQIELPAVVDASFAATLSQQLLSRRWAQRDKVRVRLPPQFAILEPGASVSLPTSPDLWTVDQVQLDSFVAVADLRPLWVAPQAIAPPAPGFAADASPMRTAAAQARTDAVSLFDVPVPQLGGVDQPALVLAVSSSDATWSRASVEVSAGGRSLVVPAPLRKSLLGSALSVLGPGSPFLLDLANSVDVQLFDAEQWLTSCDDDALIDGANLAVLGDELIQFGDAEALGNGAFRLRRLLRGRFGSEWAIGGRQVGDRFLLLRADAIRVVPLPEWAIGASVTAELMRAGSDVASTSMTFAGESVHPPAPIDLQLADIDAIGVKLAWTRRSRRAWFWLDNADAPLAESRETYLVDVQGSGSTLELQVGEPVLQLTQAQVEALGPGEARIEVRQIGDFGASRPAELLIALPGETS